MAIAPLPPGCALIRDVRTWHSGTPNLGALTRYLPSCEYCPPEYLDVMRNEASQNDYGAWVFKRYGPQRSMPQEVFTSLGETGQRLCRQLAQVDDL